MAVQSTAQMRLCLYEHFFCKQTDFLCDIKVSKVLIESIIYTLYYTLYTILLL